MQDGGEAFGTRVQDECKASWIRVGSVGSLVAAGSRRGVISGDKCRVILGQAGAEGRFRGLSATRRERPVQDCRPEKFFRKVNPVGLVRPSGDECKMIVVALR